MLCPHNSAGSRVAPILARPAEWRRVQAVAMPRQVLASRCACVCASLGGRRICLCVCHLRVFWRERPNLISVLFYSCLVFLLEI